MLFGVSEIQGKQRCTEISGGKGNPILPEPGNISAGFSDGWLCTDDKQCDGTQYPSIYGRNKQLVSDCTVGGAKASTIRIQYCRDSKGKPSETL